MHLFLTSVLPFLAHNHPAAAAFLTCRHHNFHASIIPEFLSDEERVDRFCEARQQNQPCLREETPRRYKHLYNLFVQTPLMQFSPSLVLRVEGWESILKSLLATKYFTCSLQRCSVIPGVLLSSAGVPLSIIPVTNELVRGLSKIRSLANLDLGWSKVENEHLEIIVDSFSSLETLTIHDAQHLEVVDPNTAININSPPATKTIASSPPPASLKTLRNLTMERINGLFATHFVPNFPNLRKLELRGKGTSQKLDLLPLTSSLSLLADLWESLKYFNLESTESLKNLCHLSSVAFTWCHLPDSLNFLTQEKSFSHLTKILICDCSGLSTSSFASFSHAPEFRVLEVMDSVFNNDCFQYLENMVHLRALDLSYTDVVGESRSLKTLMQNLFQLEELSLSHCKIGNKGAIAGTLYSTHSRLRVLNLGGCELVDDDLNGIGALKNTLEDLELSSNDDLTSEVLVHCQDLMKLKKLNVLYCCGINNLSPLKHCLNLEALVACGCKQLTDDSCRVFSEEPNSFPNLYFLSLLHIEKLTEKFFEHLSKNNNFVHRLKDLRVWSTTELLHSSETARNICQLKGLRRLSVISNSISKSDRNKLKGELLQKLKNLEEVVVGERPLKKITVRDR